MKEKSTEIQKKITRSEICNGVSLFFEHIPLKKMFSLLIIQNNDTTMFLLCIYLSKGIEVKR